MSDFVINERFEVLELIGTGGMASVYKVKDKNLDKVFAAKVLSEKLTHDQAAVKRFFQEAKASSTLDHQNVVSVYDSGTTDGGVPYIVMDYLEGVPLNAALQAEGALKFERAIEIFVQIAHAMAALNAENPFKVMMNHVQTEPDPFRSDVQIPDGLKQVIFCCLAKDPADRYQKMEALRDDLALIRDGKPPLAVKKPSKKKVVGRNRTPAWAAALLVGVVAVAGVVGVTHMMKPQETVGFAPGLVSDCVRSVVGLLAGQLPLAVPF